MNVTILNEKRGGITLDDLKAGDLRALAHEMGCATVLHCLGALLDLADGKRPDRGHLIPNLKFTTDVTPEQLQKFKTEWEAATAGPHHWETPKHKNNQALKVSKKSNKVKKNTSLNKEAGSY